MANDLFAVGNDLLMLTMVLMPYFTILPTIQLLRYYRKSKVADYLLFAVYFIVNGLFALTAPLWLSINTTGSYMISRLLGCFYLLIYITAIRIKWDKPPRNLEYIGVAYFSIQLFAISLYESVTVPVESTFYFFNIRTADWSYRPEDHGLVTQGG